MEQNFFNVNLISTREKFRKHGNPKKKGIHKNKNKKEGEKKRVSKSKTHLIIISIEYCK